MYFSFLHLTFKFFRFLIRQPPSHQIPQGQVKLLGDLQSKHEKQNIGAAGQAVILQSQSGGNVVLLRTAAELSPYIRHAFSYRGYENVVILPKLSDEGLLLIARILERMDVQEKAKMAKRERRVEVSELLNEYTDPFLVNAIKDAQFLQIELISEQANHILERRNKQR